MADKLTQQITDALAKAAADPAGLPLYATKSDPGLFPATAKNAAQRCLADGLVRVTRTETKGKSPRECYGLTDAGWEYLLAAVNPKQVLEDFVRVLETRQGEVGELLDTARHMADSLQSLKDAVARVLPRVTKFQINVDGRREPVAPSLPSPLAGEGGPRSGPGEGMSAEVPLTRSLRSLPSPTRGEGVDGNGTAVLEAPAVTELAGAVLARLSDWAASANAGEDCPLPELFRSLTTRDPAPSIGEFHDCLRQLHADGAVYLHPWTGPLYALPEPAYALLVGHGVAYYASLREAGVRSQGSGVSENPDSVLADF